MRKKDPSRHLAKGHAKNEVPCQGSKHISIILGLFGVCPKIPYLRVGVVRNVHETVIGLQVSQHQHDFHPKKFLGERG